MFAILGLMAIIVLCVGDSIYKGAQMKDKYEALTQKGAFLPPSGIRKDIILQDIYDNWYGDRTMFPKEYRAYLALNDAALSRYITGLLCQKEIAEGYRPSFCIGTYDRDNYHPFKAFNNLYGEKIRLLNETGNYYS